MSKVPAKKNGDSIWSPTVKIVAVVCAVVLIAALVLAFVAKSGYFRRNTVVMEVGDYEISALEFNYSYSQALNEFYSDYYYYLSYIGFNTSVSLKSQTCYFDSTKTWYDYFVDSAKTQIEEVYLLYSKAVANGFEMTQESKESLEKSIEDLYTYAEEENMSVNKYLSSIYGKNMTLEDYREFASRRLLSADFYDAYIDTLEYTDGDIKKYYEDNKSTYEFAEYYQYSIKGTTDKTAAQIAEEFKSINSVSAFVDMIKSLEGKDKFLESTYQKKDVTYTKNDKTSEWVFDDARVNGEVTVLTNEDDKKDDAATTYTAICFVSCGPKSYNLATMRHILFQVENLTDEDGNPLKDTEGKVQTNDAEMKAKAEEILKQWQEGEKTVDSFAALVKDNTDDTSSAETGGLYEDFDQGYMVKEIDEWIWKDGRKAGDCEIVKTEYGYHIVYFVEYGEVKWKADVIAAKNAEDYKAYLETLKSEFKVEFYEDGLSQVG